MGWDASSLVVDIAAIFTDTEDADLKPAVRKVMLKELVELMVENDWDTQADAYGYHDELDAVLVELGYVTEDEEEEEDDGAELAALQAENTKLKEQISKFEAQLYEKGRELSHAKQVELLERDRMALVIKAQKQEAYFLDNWVRVFAMRLGVEQIKKPMDEVVKAIDSALVEKLSK